MTSTTTLLQQSKTLLLAVFTLICTKTAAQPEKNCFPIRGSCSNAWHKPALKLIPLPRRLSSTKKDML